VASFLMQLLLVIIFAAIQFPQGIQISASSTNPFLKWVYTAYSFLYVTVSTTYKAVLDHMTTLSTTSSASFTLRLKWFKRIVITMVSIGALESFFYVILMFFYQIPTFWKKPYTPRLIFITRTLCFVQLLLCLGLFFVLPKEQTSLYYSFYTLLIGIFMGYVIIFQMMGVYTYMSDGIWTNENSKRLLGMEIASTVTTCGQNKRFPLKGKMLENTQLGIGFGKITKEGRYPLFMPIVTSDVYNTTLGNKSTLLKNLAIPMNLAIKSSVASDTTEKVKKIKETNETWNKNTVGYAHCSVTKTKPQQGFTRTILSSINSSSTSK